MEVFGSLFQKFWTHLELSFCFNPLCVKQKKKLFSLVLMFWFYLFTAVHRQVKWEWGHSSDVAHTQQEKHGWGISHCSCTVWNILVEGISLERKTMQLMWLNCAVESKANKKATKGYKILSAKVQSCQMSYFSQDWCFYVLTSLWVCFWCIIVAVCISIHSAICWVTKDLMMGTQVCHLRGGAVHVTLGGSR